MFFFFFFFFNKGHWTTSASSPDFPPQKRDFYTIRNAYLCSRALARTCHHARHLEALMQTVFHLLCKLCFTDRENNSMLWKMQLVSWIANFSYIDSIHCCFLKSEYHFLWSLWKLLKFWIWPTLKCMPVVNIIKRFISMIHLIYLVLAGLHWIFTTNFILNCLILVWSRNYFLLYNIFKKLTSIVQWEDIFVLLFFWLSEVIQVYGLIIC